MKGFIALLAAACLALLMAACGGNGEGPELGDFPAITKGDQDPPFPLTAPSSRSPAAFTFTSSEPTVATIEGSMVTIHGVGTTTITASQPGVGGYGPTSKSTTLTVKAGATPAVTCVSPAELKNNVCVVPGTIATVDTTNPAQTWTITKEQVTWTNARDYCLDSKINDKTGWRLPSVSELDTLFKSNALSGKNWALGNTWSSEKGPSTSSQDHRVVNLSNRGTSSDLADTSTAYVTCVR